MRRRTCVHLRVAVACAAGTVLLAGCVLSGERGGAPGDGRALVIESSPATSPGPSAPDVDGVADSIPAAVPAAAVNAAVSFAGAWARPDLPADRWREDITVLATTEYATLLRTVDPANVPATRIVGQAVPRESTTLRVTVDVPTDAGTLTVFCVAPHGRWVVASVQMREQR